MSQLSIYSDFEIIKNHDEKPSSSCIAILALQRIHTLSVSKNRNDNFIISIFN